MFRLSLKLMGVLFAFNKNLRKEIHNKDTGFIFNASYQFNIKLAPKAGEAREKTLDLFMSYVMSFFDLGGMQWQCNVIDADTLKKPWKPLNIIIHPG